MTTIIKIIDGDSEDQEAQFRRVIEEKLGHDMAVCFDDIMRKHKERMEEISYNYFKNAINEILDNFEIVECKTI